MANGQLSPPDGDLSLDISSASTMVQQSENSSSSRLPGKMQESPEKDITESSTDIENGQQDHHATAFEMEILRQAEATYSSIHPRTKGSKKARWKSYFAPGGKLRPFRLVRRDIGNIRKRYISDWTLFNQLIFASAVYVFFTNILPGITFASDLYVLTDMNWGTIEVVFSTGLCGIIFSLWDSNFHWKTFTDSKQILHSTFNYSWSYWAILCSGRKHLFIVSRVFSCEHIQNR